MFQDDDVNKAVPHSLSDHDERSEELATDKDWDRSSDDPAAKAGQRLAEFESGKVPLSDEDWEKEERTDDAVPGRIEEAVDASLEEMIDQELQREDGESLD